MPFYRGKHAALLLALLATAAVDPSSNPASDVGQGWRLESIPWQTRGANGMRYAFLEGHREAPGQPFTYAFAIPAGLWDAPHRHSTTARVFVASGILRLGYGATPDHRLTTNYPAGSIVVVPGGAVHFDGADVDTIIIGVASGPWSTSYIGKGTPASAGTPIR
jgi:hypothetical protein